MDKLLIIEDEHRVGDTIKRGLEQLGYLVDHAGDGESGVALFKAGDYAAVICDVLMPGMGGFEALKLIKRHCPSTPVLMLTALGEIDDKLEGFDAGADDYMVKPFDIRELEARMRSLIKRSPLNRNQQQRLSYADLEIDLLSKTVVRAENPLKLTPKEYNLLCYMVRNAERVLSRGEIAENVWNTTFDTGTNFIDVYINYLRKKIDRDYPVRLIHTRPGMGFILSSHENQD